MLSKSRVTLLLLLVCFTASAQETRKLIEGKIVQSTKGLGEVHVINLNSGEGAVSNDVGSFSIHVKENDSILISSIQYVNQRIEITGEHIENRHIQIALEPEVNILDEVFLHGLSGNLTVDLLKVPPDNTPKHNFTYSPKDLLKTLPADRNGPLSAPNSLALTDPTYMGGFGASATIPDKRLQASKLMKEKLARKKVFPDKLMRTLGTDFFLVTLKIPKDRLYHFISYCEVRNIEALYYENKLLQLIQILRDESLVYLAAVQE